MSGSMHRKVAITALTTLHVFLAETSSDITFSGFYGSWGGYTLSLSLILAAGVLGTSLPDLDLRYLRRIRWITRLLPHRGPSHSILGVLMIGGPLVYGLVAAGLPWFGLAFAAGWVIHIMVDCLTPAGVSLFWPHRGRLRLLPRCWCLRKLPNEYTGWSFPYALVLLFLLLAWLIRNKSELDIVLFDK